MFSARATGVKRLNRSMEDSQPCADCGLPTLPRDKNGHPQKGKCEYFRVPNALWKSVARGADFLCVGCLEQRLGRKLGPQDFLITRQELHRALHPDIYDGSDPSLEWCDIDRESIG